MNHIAPLRVLQRAVYRGPSIFAGHPMIRITLDLGGLEQLPSDRLDGFADHLLTLLPGLGSHHCSRGYPGGFAERLREGTWLGHVIEHVALELQTAAGSPVTRGKTRSARGRPGAYHVLFSYREEAVGLAAGRLAIELVAALLPAHLRDVQGLDIIAPALSDHPTDPIGEGVSRLMHLVESRRLGPTTQAIVDEARRRGIAVRRLDDERRIRFGQGANQTWIRGSITSRTSHLAVVTAADKELTKRQLRAAGLPVPRGTVADTAEDAVAAAAALPGAAVLKPLDGNHGRGVSRGVRGEQAVRAAFAIAAKHGRRVIVEEELAGADHRVLVIGGRVAAVAERRPAQVTGDGVRTIDQLIRVVNADPRRGHGHGRELTRIETDGRLRALLAGQGLGLESVPAAGQVVVLRETANLSTGGEAVDRTDEIHPAVATAAERAARTIGLDIAGIDLLTTDITRPLAETGGGIIEVNAAPGFRMHTAPSEGRPRDVAGAVLDTLYPPGTRSRIPIASVTGTNGKSTTVRMIAHLVESTGRVVGMTTTSGVSVGGQFVLKADASGPRSARLVLADPSVQAAVFETARGGILREGLAYNRADVGVVLNVSADHLGLGGIDTLGQLARVKAVVARRVRRRGMTVLNADDPRTLRMAARAGGRVALFTLNGETIEARGLGAIATSGVIVAAHGDALVAHEDGVRTPLGSAADLPSTLGGVARFNVANALAAAAAGRGLGLSWEQISSGLATFSTGYDQNPGRFNVVRAAGFTAIVDYAHNPAALAALGEAIAAMRTDGARTIGVVSTPGDRRDADILEIGRLAASIFDTLVFRELPDGRGRAPGGVLALLAEGARSAGAADERILIVPDEAEATATALRLARHDDIVAVMPTHVEDVWQQVLAFAAEREPVDA
ncbi:MAG TPA: cyanophycin synthetase [Pseudolysinimonas sp.]|nr:cyanophycin synthetase [Pseudolysinimonas sp.]